MTDMSVFAKTIMEQKYSHDKEDGGKETWEEISKRVAKNVLKAINAPKEKIKELEKLIAEKKFIPGGRYLYASGKPFHQVQNCLLLKAEDSREGWADLMQKATMALMTGAGIGIDYSDIRPEGKLIRKTGGVATGPLALMQMINEAGRGIMQGGSRRSAIWAGLSWRHADIHKFIRMKDWISEVRSLKEKDFNFPATMDGTNISVLLDDEFFKAYENDKHKLHQQAHSVYWAVVKQMLKTAEPGFSIDTGNNVKETLRNACVSGDTEILTRLGYQRIDNLINSTIDVWNGHEWSSVTPKVTGTNQEMFLVTFSDGRTLNCTGYHNFVISKDYRGGTELVKAKDLIPGMKIAKYTFPIIESGENCEFAYAQGFISAEGMDDYNWLSLYEPKFVCEERLSKFAKKIGDISRNRKTITFNFNKFPKSMVPFNWNLKSKLDWLAGLFDGDGCELKEGGLQLSSVDFTFLDNLQKLLSTIGVNSKIVKANPAGYRMMPDGHGNYKEYFCKESKRICVGAVQMQFLKKLGLKCERLLFDKIPNRDAGQFITVVDITENGTDKEVYCFNEPKNHTGCFNGIITGQCTEVTSADDSDICNLGSINMAEIQSLEEMQKVVDLATYFLLAGTVYSDVPYAKVDQIRTKNRRLGLGLMGLHEWLLKHGKTYGPDEELEKYLQIYQTSTDIAHKYAEDLGLSKPVKTRAIAPTGCQRPDTIVTTEDGMLTLGELGNINGEKWQSLGLKVSQETFTSQTATRFFLNGFAKTKKIKLTSGVELECTPNHKYRVLRNGQYTWIQAQNINVGDLLVVSLGGYQKESNCELIPVKKHYRTEVLPKFPIEMTTDLAHFMGLFFADGSMHEKGIRIACNAKETDWKDIATLGKKLFEIKPTFFDNGRGCISVCFNSSALLRWLYTNNLDKPECLQVMVPSVIRCSSKNSLQAFIEGYWRGDGSKSGNNRYIDTANPELAKQLVSLSRGLGRDAAIISHISGMGSIIFRVNFVQTKRRCHTSEISKQLNLAGLKNVTVDEVKSISDSESMTMDIEVPVTKTYIANGIVSHNTIGILAETTTGIEPIFCVAYKRRYLKGSVWHYQYVIDPTAKRLIEKHNVNPENIEDAYDLSKNVEKRLEFQAWVQKYVDHAISSTLNLPSWGSEENNDQTVQTFGNILIKYLPHLRGMTCYPDGARGGQPLTPIKYNTAIKHVGEIFVEQADMCDITKGGSCGV